MKSKETIVILDFYSQFNQLIARRVRALSYTHLTITTICIL